MNTTKALFGLLPVSIAFILLFGMTFALPAQANHPEDNEDTHGEEVMHADKEKLEQMVVILKQLVALLTEYRSQYGAYPVQTYTDTHVDTHADEHSVVPVDDHAEVLEEEEQDEHEHEAAASTAQLVIEIESHMGKTHAHVRYTDKPEEMFFVDVAITDENAIVDALVAKTGMSVDIVQSALKYMW
jgi:hypothetical protein